MFQFTSTTIVNSNLDSSGLPRWEVLTDPVTGDDIVQIKRLNNFKVSETDVVTGDTRVCLSATRKAYSLPAIASSTIDVTNITTEGEYILTLYVGLTQDSQNSYYSNDLAYKGKPFLYSFRLTAADIAAGTTALATQIANLINSSYNRFKDYKFFTATAATNFITLTAKDEFQTFKKVKLEYYDPASINQALTEVDLNLTVVTAAKSGFGTFYWLQTNISLPTVEKFRLGADNREELPVAGANYDQFTLTYVQRRPELGSGNVVGAHRQETVTRHILYVQNSGAAATAGTPSPTPAGVSLDFQTFLTTAGVPVTQVAKY